MAFVVVGKVNSAAFQKCKALIAASSAAAAATITPLFAADFEKELTSLKKTLGGLAYDHTGDVAAYTKAGEWIGGDADLLVWLKRKGCVPSAASLNGDGKSTWESKAEAEFIAMMNSTGNKYTFVEISIDGSSIGRLVFELFAKLAPKTCANFEALCTGEKGKSKARRPRQPAHSYRLPVRARCRSSLAPPWCR